MKRALLALLLIFGFLSPVARATWSIVLVHRGTGEVAAGQATCIVGPDLQKELAVVIPGRGAACVQAWWDFDGLRRQTIWDELQAGSPPRDIVTVLRSLPSPELHQYGIVSVDAPPATWTGNTAGAWAGGVSGQVGEIAYAIQGNVLAGEAVALHAERAVRQTEGDLAAKLMAGMLAAAEAGGDGRCSCSFPKPTSCRAPIPGFNLIDGKSAHSAFILVARVGDSLGSCGVSSGCANGAYYMDLRTPGQSGLPDPIVELRGEYAAWRTALHGRPDQLLSEAELDPQQVPGNGAATSELRIRLVDLRGEPLPGGGAAVAVTHAPTSAGLASPGAPVDHGDGTYTVPITAGTGQGTDVFEVRVDDGGGAVLLYPFPVLEHL